MMALKRFNVAASIFDVGTVNYRKTLKLGQINETSLGRIFSLYIKRARFNVGLSRNDIAELVKTIRNPDKPLLNFMKKISTLNRMLADMSLTFTKAATGDLSSPGLE